MVKDGWSHKNAEHHPNVEKVAREFESVASEIVQECAGLPLSLQIVGNCLGRKKNSVGTAVTRYSLPPIILDTLDKKLRTRILRNL
jgi:hypothetical protein